MVNSMGIGLSAFVVGWLAAPAATAQGGVERYCDPATSGISLQAQGSTSLEANDGHGNLELIASNAPAPFGWFVMGDLKLMRLPFGVQGGGLCVASTRTLLAVQSHDAQQQVGAGAGAWMLRHTLDYLEGDVLGAAVQLGSTWNVQFLHRQGSELAASNALEIRFGPPLELAGWETVAIGSQSQHPEAAHAGVLLIDDPLEWGAFQLEHNGSSHPGLGTSPADFAHESVLVVFAGEQWTSGHHIAIVELALSVTTLDIRTMSTAPGAGCSILPVITHPYHIVRLPRVADMQIGAWSNTERHADPCN